MTTRKQIAERLKARIKKVSLEMKQIPNEPCAGVLYCCYGGSPENHTKWHNLMVKREELLNLLERAK